MTTPPDQIALPIAPPLLVRKVDRGSYWRSVLDDGTDGRVTAAEAVFPRDADGTTSVFLVHSIVDLQRVAMGLNSMRTGSSLTEEIKLLAFSPEEVNAAGIQLVNSNGDTKCSHANRLHRGLLYDADKIRSLVDLLFDSNRQLFKLSKGKLKAALDAATKDKCGVVLAISAGCVCESQVA